MKTFSLFIMILMTSLGIVAQESKDIQLPAPRTSGGMPLMDALKVRQTGRVFNEQALEWQQVSDLLWAAWGINRPESGRRTAPSARNFQETTLYVSLKSGIYQWNEKSNVLSLLVAGDQRDKIGRQPFVATAPLIVIFVADYAKYGDMTPEQSSFYSGIDAGYISQNLYLYCASAKLSTVVLGSVNRDEVSKLLNLGEKQKVVVAQPVGYPGEE